MKKVLGSKAWTIAGFILGRVDYRYLSFGVLAFLWGLFMIGQRISGYLNLWVKDPTVCMAIMIMLKYCLMIAILFYLKVNLKRERGRMYANLVAAGWNAWKDKNKEGYDCVVTFERTKDEVIRLHLQIYGSKDSKEG